LRQHKIFIRGVTGGLRNDMKGSDVPPSMSLGKARALLSGWGLSYRNRLQELP
jgi:hypothetical protein